MPEASVGREDLIEVGQALRPHGFRGECKCELWCDDTASAQRAGCFYVKDSGGVYVSHIVESLRPIPHPEKLMAIVRLSGIDDEAKARLLAGAVLFARRDALSLPDSAYFLTDTVGLRVIDAANGTVYGAVREVQTLAGRDLLAVALERGGEALIPALPQFIARVQPGEAVYVNVIEGLIE